MAEIQQGAVAVVWGSIADGTFTVSGGSIAWRHSDISVNNEAAQVETQGEDGETINVTTYGATQTITVNCFPAASSKANAAIANVLPTAGQYLGIISAADADIAATTPGKLWLIQSASKTRTNTNKVMFTITAKRWAGISTYSPLA